MQACERPLTRGRAFSDGLDPKLVRRKKSKKRLDAKGCELKKEREKRDREREASVSRHEAFPKDRVAAQNKPGWSPPLNVTQAAVHKGEMERKTPQKKKKKKIRFRGVGELGGGVDDALV